MIKTYSKIIISLICLFCVIGFVGCNKPPIDPIDDGITKICLIINGSLGDKSFFDSANEGINLIKAEYPDVQTTVMELGQDSSKWEASLREASESKVNYDLIIVGTDQMRERLQRIARQFPNKKYIIFDSDINKEAKGQTYPNVYSIQYKQNEGSFLAGVLAASWLQTLQAERSNLTAGFVGGLKSDIIKDFAAGYYQGLLYVNNLEGMKTTKTYSTYVGGFTDSATGKSYALAQYNNSANPAGILFQAASQSGLGCIDAAKEVNKYIIGVDSDQYEYFIHSGDMVKAERIITSVLKRVDLSLYDAIVKFMNDTLQFGESISLGLKDEINGEQIIGLAKNEYYLATLPLNVRNMIDDAEARIIAGTLIINSAYTLTLTQFNQLEDSVKA